MTSKSIATDVFQQHGLRNFVAWGLVGFCVMLSFAIAIVIPFSFVQRAKAIDGAALGLSQRKTLELACTSSHLPIGVISVKPEWFAPDLARVVCGNKGVVKELDAGTIASQVLAAGSMDAYMQTWCRSIGGGSATASWHWTGFDRDVLTKVDPTDEDAGNQILEATCSFGGAIANRDVIYNGSE